MAIVKFICGREAVDTIGDIPYGKGYALVSTEFDEAIRKILQLNYGLILISHAKVKTEKKCKRRRCRFSNCTNS